MINQDKSLLCSKEAFMEWFPYPLITLSISSCETGARAGQGATWPFFVILVLSILVIVTWFLGLGAEAGIKIPGASGRGIHRAKNQNRTIWWSLCNFWYDLPWFLTYLLITMLTNCTYKISITPKLPSPQLLFYMSTATKYFSGCNTSYHRHYFSYIVSRYRLN